MSYGDVVPFAAMSGFSIAGWIVVSVAALALLFYFVGIAATWRHTRRRPALASVKDLPPVSMLKPLKGLEDELEQNLESFFAQDYPAPFEIVISTTEVDDPALEVARRVAARYPHVPTQFVVGDDEFGLNPKVANLSGAVPAARYDLVHQSDANVRVPSDYLRRIVGEFVANDASILTSVVIGVGERSIGGALENLQLSAYIAPAMCLALEAANITCVCGKSMLLRKSELREFGGLESVRNVLCEDFVLGERYKAAGKTVLLSPTTVENVNADCGLDRFFGRHSRWLKMRITLHVPGFFADLFSNPIGLSALAMLFSAFDPWVCLAAASVMIAKTLADQFALTLTRTRMPLRYAWLSLLKDLALIPLWVFAIFSRTVVWRGRRLRFGRNTQLVPLDPAPELAGHLAETR